MRVSKEYPAGYIPLSGFWVQLTDEHYQNPDEFYMKYYTPNLQPPSHDYLVVRPDIHSTCNVDANIPKGCSLFAAADLLGITASELVQEAARLSESGDFQIENLVVNLATNDGKWDDIAALYKKLAIITSGTEIFPSYSAMMAALKMDPERSWNGALIFDGHMIRAAQNNGSLELWDPQGLLGTYILPTDKKMHLITFA